MGGVGKICLWWRQIHGEGRQGTGSNGFWEGGKMSYEESYNFLYANGMWVGGCEILLFRPNGF